MEYVVVGLMLMKMEMRFKLGDKVALKFEK